MIRAERVAQVLLAAGLSTRFGAEDKLAAPLNGLPLGRHAARTVAALPFAARIAVTGARPLDLTAYGFTAIENGNSAAGQGKSIALGVSAARPLGVDAVLVMLADMPFVTIEHFTALLDAFDERGSLIASTTADWSGPPVLFGAAHFDLLEQQSGDNGPRALIKTAKLVAAPSTELIDIDTQQDLRSATMSST